MQHGPRVGEVLCMLALQAQLDVLVNMPCTVSVGAAANLACGSKTCGNKNNPREHVPSCSAPCNTLQPCNLVCRELGYQVVEVNASDARGKSDAKASTGMGGGCTS